MTSQSNFRPSEMPIPREYFMFKLFPAFGTSRMTAALLFVVILVDILLLSCSPIRMMVRTSTEIKEMPELYGIPYEEIWIGSADQSRLHAYYISGWPERPVVVFFHGNAGNISDRVPNLCSLRTIGTPILIFDYRGYGQTEGKPKNEQSFYEDGRAAISFLKSRGWEASRMIYYGRSMGAAMALQMAIEDPPAGLVMEAGWTSMKAEVRHSTPFLYYTVGWWGIPDIFNSIEKIEQLQVPLVLIHGDQDRIVPPWMSEELYKKAPKPKSLHVILGGRHSDNHLVGGSIYWDIWISFLNDLGVNVEIIPENKVCEDDPVKISK